MTTNIYLTNEEILATYNKISDVVLSGCSDKCISRLEKVSVLVEEMFPKDMSKSILFDVLRCISDLQHQLGQPLHKDARIKNQETQDIFDAYVAHKK